MIEIKYLIESDQYSMNIRDLDIVLDQSELYELIDAVVNATGYSKKYLGDVSDRINDLEERVRNLESRPRREEHHHHYPATPRFPGFPRRY